ncbi:MAG TPA: hypothetical protein VGO62_13035, partial [Myxococcota bacterium]
MNRVLRVLLVLLAPVLVAMLAFPSCKTTQPVHALSPTGKLLTDLSVFALGRPLPPSEIAKSESQVASGSLTVDQFIADMLARPMGGRLAKDIVLGGAGMAKDRHPVPAQATLRSTKGKDGGEGKIYYLREKCSQEEAVKVKPWWAPEKEVLVCPNSYRPEVKGDDKGRTCGAEMLSPRDVDTCGCGPWLMFCTESQEQWQKTQDRVQSEVTETAGYVIDGNLPIEKLFTMNETVRNNDAEFLYRRARVLAGEDPDKLFPVTGFGDYKGKLEKRVDQVPDQQAGILSTPALTYSSDALRGVMRNVYDWMWCAGVQSSHVTTDSVLGLDVVDLRVGDGWKKLASMNICTDCHARLDYGMQFFHGYPSSTMGVDFRPSQSLPGEGPLYRRSIKDTVGTAPLTPGGFAKLATAVPEFGDCMTRRVVDHVFGGANTAADYDAVRDTFDKSHKIKEMLRVAMTRFAHRPPSEARRADQAPAPVAAPVNDDGKKIALSPALMKMLKRDCKECHDKDDSLNLLVPELDKATLALALDRVGFGAMPKNATGLDDDERLALVSELARHVYSAEDDR